MGETQPEVKRLTAKRKAEIVMNIFQGKTTVAEASRQYDLTPAQIEEWMEEARRGMENQLRARPKDIASMMARLKELEEENRRLKKMYAEERLKAEIVQEALEKKW